MRFYDQTADKVLYDLSSSRQGLTEQEAAERLERQGLNKLQEGKRVSLFKRFLLQLREPMTLILLAAAAVSGVTAVYSGESFTDAVIILAVVLINALLGVYQESKAEKAIEALQQMTAATCKVLRNGQPEVIKSEMLVAGDVILLEAGDAVPADGRLIQNASLKVEEAALTGESVPVEKEVETLPDGQEIPLGDRRNMVYMGSSVAYGRGQAVVTRTGMDTEMGKIATALSSVKQEETPLQKKLARLGRSLSWLVLGICIFIFVFSLLRAGSFRADTVLDTFLVAVSLAVAAIPEGLAAVVTVVLSIGVTNMSKRNAVIRRLTAVETLGSAQVICSDKTGTLTQNRMSVADYTGDQKAVASAMALCSDARQDQGGMLVGEPTEAALVSWAARLGLTKQWLERQNPRVAEVPFDSGRKMMSTLHADGAGFVQYTKGAPDEVLRRCTHYRSGKEVLPLERSMRAQIAMDNKRMADRALRVLAVAQRHWQGRPKTSTAAEWENGMVFLGLTGLVDPVRPEAVKAVQECRKAGIRPVMITGDHKDTAVAVAKELGIIENARQAITGAELGAMPDAEFERNIERYGVYARVQPEHKVRIVTTWKKRGCITAMTGDGVNDAPSIKAADIGVGMGITGTDVTKSAADMVLADDNFATIVAAVGEGRRIYDNIRKAIQFLLASNMSEVVGIFAATLLGFTLLRPVHLLWINLITDCFPALALGMERADPDIMSRPPRKPNEGIFAHGMGADIAYQGVLVAAITLASYVVGHYIESGVWELAQSADGMTMAFLTMSMAEIFHSFNMRSQRGSVFNRKSHNWLLWGAMLLSLTLSTVILYVPFLAGAFGFTHISPIEYGISLLLAVCVIPVVETVKFFQRRAGAEG